MSTENSYSGDGNETTSEYVDFEVRVEAAKAIIDEFNAFPDDAKLGLKLRASWKPPVEGAAKESIALGDVRVYARDSMGRDAGNLLLGLKGGAFVNLDGEDDRDGTPPSDRGATFEQVAKKLGFRKFRKRSA